MAACAGGTVRLGSVGLANLKLNWSYFAQNDVIRKMFYVIIHSMRGNIGVGHPKSAQAMLSIPERVKRRGDLELESARSNINFLQNR